MPRTNVPRRLTLSMPDCQEYYVFLNGVRQLSCTLADADKGYIIRYRKSLGSRPIGTATEVIRGKVEIRRKGEARQIVQAEHASVGGACADAAQADPGNDAGAPCGQAAPENAAS